MNRTTPCLQTDTIESLLAGQLTPEELTAAEEHVSQCSTCRRRIETTIGSSQWWEEACGALAEGDQDAPGGPESPDKPRVASPSDRLLELLGPSDDPRMLGRIDSYEVVGLIGQGGMGAVFKAFDAALNRYVAIKMLLPHLAHSGVARKRFAREAQAAAAVIDDHVMPIHCVSQWQGVPYFVMPYSRGTSLQKRLNQQGPLELREILRIGLQTARGLAAAHAQGIVHRDVKPANILLDENVERVALVDFGLARAVDDASLTHSGTLAGTPQYMSPEQARAESVDARSDLFSLGAVLYAMCTGSPPFRAETSYGVLRMITDREPRPIREINPDIPEWLCRIISRLMSKDPADRFASAHEVAELLEDCLAHVQQPTAVPLPEQLRDVRPAAGGARNRWSMGRLLAGAAIPLILIFSGILVVLELNKGTLLIESRAGDVPVRITQGDEVVEKLTVTRAGELVRIAAGTYIVQIDGNTDGISIENGTVTLERGGSEIVRIVRDESAEDMVASNSTSGPPSNRTGSVEQPQDVATEVRRQPNGAPPKTPAERAVARLVLVFFEDRSRRAVPAVLVDAGSQTLVVTTGPATVVPDGAPHAVDRAFLIIQGRGSVDAHYMPESTAELFVYRTDGGLTNYRPDERVELAVGDVLSAVTTGTTGASQPPRTRSTARVVALDRDAELDLPDHKIQHQFDGLVEINRSLPEGTPLFKSGRLAGLTLLGTRFLGDKASKSYVVPIDRVASLCRELTPASDSADYADGDNADESSPTSAAPDDSGGGELHADYQSILGEWEVVSVEGTGGRFMSLSDETHPGDRLVIAHVETPGGRRRLWLSEELRRHWSRDDSLHLHPEADPSRLTYKARDGKGSHFDDVDNPPDFGIYRIEGDELTILAGNPHDFKVKQGTKVAPTEHRTESGETSPGRPAVVKWKVTIPNYPSEFQLDEGAQQVLVKLRRVASNASEAATPDATETSAKSIGVEAADQQIQYLTPGMVRVQPPASISDGAWGGSTDGLRIAAIADPDSVKVGEVIPFKIVVENTSERAIKFSASHLTQSARADVRRTNGDQVQTSTSGFSGFAPVRRYLLQPGQRVVVAEPSLTVVEDPDDGRSRPGLTKVILPGNRELRNHAFIVRYTIVLGRNADRMRENDAEALTGGRVRGEWIGSLTSGPIAVVASRGN